MKIIDCTFLKELVGIVKCIIPERGTILARGRISTAELKYKQLERTKFRLNFCKNYQNCGPKKIFVKITVSFIFPF